MTRKDINDDQLEQLYRSGRSLTQIGAEVGCHWTTILRRLRHRGVPIRTPGGRKRTAARLTDAPDDYIPAMPTLDETLWEQTPAQRDHEHPQVAAQGCDERPGLRRRLDVERAVALHGQGLSLSAIAAALNCHTSTVLRRLAALGLHQVRRRGENDAPAKSNSEPECGHRGSYNSNCKNPRCRNGKRRYWEARRDAIRSGAVEVGEHGVGGYRQGCPCEVCRTAVREQRRDERAKKQS